MLNQAILYKLYNQAVQLLVTFLLKNLENVISRLLVFRPLRFYQMQIQYFLNKKSTWSIYFITFGTFVSLSSPTFSEANTYY